MSTLVVRTSEVSGRCTVPGNKSISHRALMLGAMASGTSHITGLGLGADVLATIGCLRAYGVQIEDGVVTSPGIDAWDEPTDALDCANSGTTMRLLAGLAARQQFRTTLDGDASLRKRPMERVAEPLRTLGAAIETTDGRAPLRVHGGDLTAAQIDLEVASAQVKTAVMFAALGASGETVVTEPTASRDHTERMLRSLGAPIDEAYGEVHTIRVRRFDVPTFATAIPGDVSSAAFVVAAALLAGEETIVEGVGLNPTRTSFISTCAAMGGHVVTDVTADEMGEPIGAITTKRSDLRGRIVDGSDPGIHDELPLVALLATQADGETVVKEAGELRVKESDRIDAVVRSLRAFGADIHELVDGFVVRGPRPLRSASVDSFGDHRIAMMLAVAGLIADGETTVTNFECADVSWPAFDEALRHLGADVELR
jgi:3-phosphoshikimate 1-carboxyvinyltransferase